MDVLEENNKKKSLPYLTTKDNVKKLIEATKVKEGLEDSIRSLFGKGKYPETKRTLQTFNILSEDMRFTDIGRIIAYSSEEIAEQEWFKVIMNYKPYEEFIQSFRINNKNENNSIDLEEIKKFWGLRDYGSSEHNRNDALTTFAYFIVLAGIGDFKIGRKKNTSRIIISKTKLEEKIHLLENYENSKDDNKQQEEDIDNANTINPETNETKQEQKEKKEGEEENKSDDNYTVTIPVASGIAKIYIPKDTEKEDAELIRDMINIILKRKYGI